MKQKLFLPVFLLFIGVSLSAQTEYKIPRLRVGASGGIGYLTASGKNNIDGVVDHNVIDKLASDLRWATNLNGDIHYLYILLSKKGYSPNGVTLVDISQKTMQFVRSWNTGFGDRYWTSENQTYVFSQMGIVYRLPNEDTGNEIYKLGQLIPFESTYDYFGDFKWFEHSSSASKIWASYDLRDWRKKNIVVGFDDKTYQRQETVEVGDYVATIDGKKDYYKTLARYLFASATGNDLVLIKNVAEYNANAWHLEIIDVSK